MQAQRVVEISEDGRTLGVERGFLTVRLAGTEIGRVPLDDIAAVMCMSNWTLVSSAACCELARRGVPLVVCDKRGKYPVSCSIPLEGSYRQAEVMQAQADAPLPLKKRIWKEIVVAKLRQQAEVLKRFSARDAAAKLVAISGMVKSGDSGNCEARGALIYWRGLMGENFRRDRECADENALFNYGYAVLRSCAIREIVASGLHPSLAVHHKSAPNNMRLADDIMEIFRPIVDAEVKMICLDADTGLSLDNKKRLVDSVNRRIAFGDITSNVQHMLRLFSRSLARLYMGESDALDIRLAKSSSL